MPIARMIMGWSGAGDVTADEELLEELLGGAQPRIGDLDIAVGIGRIRAP